MSTIVITDAQDGVTCPSCNAEDKRAFEWVGTEWQFHCKACGAIHDVADRHASMTLWLERIPSNREELIVGRRIERCPVCTGVLDDRGPDICPNGGWCQPSEAAS